MITIDHEQTENEMEDDDGPSMLEEIRTRYQAAHEHAARWRKEAREDFDFYAGRQWTEDEEAHLKNEQRPPIVFNRIGVLVDAVVGYEVNNRQETRYIPRTAGDAKVSELLTEAARYFRDKCDAEFEESDAARDAFICGMGWTQDRLTDEETPEFDLVKDRIDPLRMLWDPSSRKPNLVDARYLMYQTEMSKEEAKALVPDWDGSYNPVEWQVDTVDDADPKDANPRHYYKGEDIQRQAMRNVIVLEYQYVDDETEHVVTDPRTGMQGAIDDERWDELDDETKAQLEPYHMTRRKRVWKRVICIGGDIFPLPHSYPKGPTFHCITGKRDRTTAQWFGIVRTLKDPQRWSNKWLMQILHMVNTSAKNGYDVEKGAIDNVAAFESKAAKPGAINTFVDGALQQGRVQRREARPLPPDLPNLLQYANESMTNVSGINQEILGLADRDQPGVLEYQRKQSAVTLLAPLFDSLRRYRKISGRSWLYHMQNYMADGRLIRITMDNGSQVHLPFQQGPMQNPAAGQTNQEGQQEDPIIQFFDPEVAEYDVIVDQSATSPNLKEATWAALQPMLQVLGKQMGPEEMLLALEYSPVPESFLEKLKTIMDQKAKNPPPNPEMMKLEADQQMKQQQLQFERDKAESDSQIKKNEALLKAQIDKDKANADQAIALQKLAYEFDLDRIKLDNQLRLDEIKANAQIKIAKEKAANQADRSVQ